MQVYGATHVHGAQPLGGPHAPRGTSPPSRTASSAGGDQLQISDAANAAARASELPAIRADLVARVRSEIASGTYETAAKLDVALDRLLDEVG
jgi:negative regulator of flagellin synthesis FlgM